MSEGLRLEFGGGAPATTLAAVNEGLAPFGARVWPLDLSGLPAEIRAALGRDRLAPDEADRVKAALLLPREALVARIAEARGAPHIPGGGALETAVVNHGYVYPQLFLVEAGADYTRFDRFHVNVADDGTAVDEVMQIVAGSGVRIHQRRPDVGAVTLNLDCPGPNAGWTVTYDGAVSHIGSFSSAAPGTKALMQVIGPPNWTMRYDDDA